MLLSILIIFYKRNQQPLQEMVKNILQQLLYTGVPVSGPAEQMSRLQLRPHGTDGADGNLNIYSLS